MFKLQDGREHLYQWDLDRYVIVEDSTIGEVHFCNRTSDCSLVVEVKDGLAPIPNILLQDARPIRVYAYVDDKYTLTEEQFTVKSRTRPDDYVYSETEVLQYSTLEEQIKNQAKVCKINRPIVSGDLEVTEDMKEIYRRAQEGLPVLVYFLTDSTHYDVYDIAGTIRVLQTDNAVWIMNTHLNNANAQHSSIQDDIQITIKCVDDVWTANATVGHYNLATTTYVDDAVAAATGVDLANYYTKGETDTAIQNAVDAIDIPEVDFTGYATEQWVIDKGYQTADQVNTLINDALGVIENGSY